jgi:hypothetical protein
VKKRIASLMRRKAKRIETRWVPAPHCFKLVSVHWKA